MAAYIRVNTVLLRSEKVDWNRLRAIGTESENASQAAEIVNSAYGADTVTANYVQFWFRRFRSGIFNVKDAPRTGRPVVENVDKITKIIKVDRHRGEAAQTVAKPILTDRKVLCIWWNCKEIIYYELLPYGQKLNSDLYCEQLDRLKLGIDQKWPELANRRGVFHQDNSRPHTSVVTRQKFWVLGWEVLMHPPYSTKLAPSFYHLFLALQNFLSDKKLGSREDYENLLLEVFTNKDQDFYERGIMKLPLKWQQIIYQNGAYLTQIGQS
ncbi:mariner Mos1 transposase [Trichonephila clavipes]|nr:mariner Mos1 transposase [Trichonephila clavipes]